MSRSYSRRTILALVVAVSALFQPVTADEKASLSRFVIVGDSLAAGFQNFSLLDSQQIHSAPALIAEQARTALELPLVPYPGVPNVLELLSAGPPPVVQPVSGPPPAFVRIDPLVQATNLAVPGHTVQDVIDKRPGIAADVLTNIVLGFPTPFVVPGPARSQLETAVALSPTFILVWIGNNDALFAAISGDPTQLTPVGSFAAAYEVVSTALAETHATMIMVNIPDVTKMPYFTSVPTLSAWTGMPEAQLGLLLGVQPGDSLRPGALPIAFAILSGQLPGPLPILCPSALPGVTTLSPCVLTAGGAAFIRARVQMYNGVIAASAVQLGAALVDLDALFRALTAGGYRVGDRRLTTDFLGGLFSLDGVHPTNTGYAIIANEIIEQMKRQLHINVPKVSVPRIAATDPLVQ